MRIQSWSIMIAASSLLFAAGPATATTFVFESENAGGNANVGAHKYLKATFDDVTDKFTWTSTFTKNTNNNYLADGAWLVVSDGPNPKSYGDEFVIYYLDGLNEKVTMYTYNGQNASNSWQPGQGTFLGSFDLDVDDSVADQHTFSFAYDMTEINNRDDISDHWKGTEFEDSIGVWFHGAENLTVKYDDDQLADFSYYHQGWYDVADKPTEAIPEPGMVMGLGVAAISTVKQLKRKSA